MVRRTEGAIVKRQVQAIKIALVLTSALAGLSGCGLEKSASVSATDKPAAAAASAPVITPKMAEPKKETVIEVSGPIIVEHQIDVTAQRDGTVIKIFVDSPARVQAGALLAKMDDRQLTAQLEAARAKTRGIEDDLKNWKAEAEVYQADYGRAQQMYDMKLLSQEQLEHAKYKAESETWDIKRVTEMLNTSRQEERAAGTGTGQNQNRGAIRCA